VPTYVYKTEDTEEGCHACAEGFRVRHLFNQVLRACTSCGSRVRKVIGRTQVMIKEQHRAGFEDYREDMARFPGDPQARVSSPEAIKRLSEQRQREGWILRDEDWGDMYNTIPKGSLEDGPDLGRDGRELVQESYEEALEELNGGE
jgi:predicted nucleic acid-binding Zn ribbon protein